MTEAWVPLVKSPTSGPQFPPSRVGLSGADESEVLAQTAGTASAQEVEHRVGAKVVAS